MLDIRKMTVSMKYNIDMPTTKITADHLINSITTKYKDAIYDGEKVVMVSPILIGTDNKDYYIPCFDFDRKRGIMKCVDIANTTLDVFGNDSYVEVSDTGFHVVADFIVEKPMFSIYKELLKDIEGDGFDSIATFRDAPFFRMGSFRRDVKPNAVYDVARKAEANMHSRTHQGKQTRKLDEWIDMWQTMMLPEDMPVVSTEVFEGMLKDIVSGGV